MDNEQQGILNSWKEIAHYLGRGVRTVQRWEAELGLPVRRPRGKRRSAVIAVMGELDRWMRSVPLHSAGNSEAGAESCAGIQILVIEDNVTDLNSCVTLLRKLGHVGVDAISSVPAALVRLEAIEAGTLPIPDLVILDLNFSVHSGFDILQYLRTHNVVRAIPVIVWTVRADNQQELCEIFGVHRVVTKLAGPTLLHDAILSTRLKAA